MDETTKDAASRTQKHREDGEEFLKQTRKVVPMDAGRGSESPEQNANTAQQTKGTHAKETDSASHEK